MAVAVRLKHVDEFTDRTGARRFYFRRGKGKRSRLPGLPGSPEFMLAYNAALAGDAAPTPTGARPRGNPGTFDRLAGSYFASPEFMRLRPRTRHVYRQAIERFLEQHGHRPVAGMRREDVKRLVGERAASPGAANDLLKKLRVLMHHAIDAGWRTDDPTLRVKMFREREFHTWTEDEIAAFETRWPIGSRERLAFALLLYTGQRRSDVVAMRWTDIAGDAIRVVQGKTGARLLVPLHPRLREVLSRAKRDHIAILTTVFGKPFSPAGFGNWLADIIGKAGVPDRCVAHGLRKAAARRLAEAGCTANEIAAITGHRTLKEVARYTRAADQERLAGAAMRKMAERTGDGVSPNRPRVSQTRRLTD